MTKTVEIEPELVPISQRADLLDVVRSYHATPASGRLVRLEGDTFLLMELQNRLAPWSRDAPVGGAGDLTPGQLAAVVMDRRSPATVGDINPRHLIEAVDRVVARTNGTWGLDGDGEDIVARIDAHFLPVQEAAVEVRRQRERSVAENVARLASQLAA